MAFRSVMVGEDEATKITWEQNKTELMWLVLDSPSSDTCGGIIQNYNPASTRQTNPIFFLSSHFPEAAIPLSYQTQYNKGPPDIVSTSIVFSGIKY